MRKTHTTKKVIKKIAGGILKLLFRIQIDGIENYPTHGKRLVIVANHVSLLDGVLLWVFLPHDLTFAVNVFTAQKWWARWTKAFTRIFLVDPTHPMAIKSLIEYIMTDRHCVIFPEGRMTITGGLMKIYEGPGLVADRAAAPILPIHIEGAQFSFFSSLSGKLRLHLFPKIKLTIFSIRYLTASPTLKGRERRKALSANLYDIMCEVAFSSQNLDTTLFQSLIETQNQYGKNKIVLEDITRKTLTYHQLIARSFILGKTIASFTKTSETIGILLPNVMTHSIVFFALQAYFRLPALLNYTMSPNQLIECCKTAHIKTILTSKKFIETGNLSPIITALNNEKLGIIFIEDIVKKINHIQSFMGLIKSLFAKTYYKKLQKINQINSVEVTKKPAVILFTSGSENTPKGVALSHQNLQANRFQLITKSSFTAQDIVFNALPLFHAFSLNSGLLTPILSGIKVFVYLSPLHFRKIPQLCYDVNATILFSTNTFLTKYIKFANPFDFFSLKYVFSGAEKLQDETRKLWLEKFGLRILEGYGTTETAPILAVNTIMQNKIGSVGKFLPSIEHQLKPIEGIFTGGELWVKGPNIMLGYLSLEKPGEFIVPEDGWHSTGDVVYIDQEGFMTIEDRVKRFAKIGGEMLSLSAIEACITTLWPDFYHAVISQLDNKKGEQLILVTTYPDATRQEIVQNAKLIGLSNLAIPKKIIFIPKMPLLATGKIDYRILHACYR